MKLKQIKLPKLNSKLSSTDRQKLIDAMSENIKSVFAQATDVEIIDGIAWYANARGYAYTLAKRFNLSLSTASAVIAALSPNVGWHRNKLDALTVLLAHADGKNPDAIKVSTYNNNKAKAFAILTGARMFKNSPPTQRLNAGTFGAVEFNAFALLGGNKTRAFADNIAHAESSEVTIDFHAASVALGIRKTTAESNGISKNQYAVLSTAYLNAANALGLRPYELQAIVWCVWRRLHNVHAMHG